MQKINQQYIANKLNISRATVSRCFTNHRGINPITRARVFKLASQLGYQHMEMRTPAHQKGTGQKTIGVLFCSDVSQHYEAGYGSPGLRLFAGVSEFAQIHKHKIELHYVDWKENSLDDPSYRKIEALHRRTWDGLLLIYSFPRNIIDELNIRFPMVSLVEQYGKESYNCVDVDHYKGIAMVMNRLHDFGHKRIGFFSLKYEADPEWPLRRFCAYVEELTRVGLPLLAEDVVNIYPQRYLTNEEAMDYAAKQVEKGVTAWVCAADHQAYEMIAEFKNRGIRCPQDVSVTGFDGTLKPKWVDNELTTVAIPYHEIGFTGAKRVVDLIKKRSGRAQHILVECQFHEGETVGPVSGKSVTVLS
ncbi:MAG: LacI family DNA-binding transcriptional regulator [Verrucomicrobiota bacterium]